MNSVNEIKVLIVEDNLLERELIKEYLLEAGYDVMTAADGKEDLKMTISLKPTLVIADLVMLEMSGLQLCRSLRKNPQTKYLPPIACTSKN
ncbi:MAG: response regulator [Geminocystis sp.]|nr:response regulator [Geminocystis sp.]MDW8462507.1 response regulator [Geminocystis sp.]